MQIILKRAKYSMICEKMAEREEEENFELDKISQELNSDMGSVKRFSRFSSSSLLIRLEVW